MDTTEHLTQDHRRNRASPPPPPALLVPPSTSSVRGDLQVVCAVNSNSEEEEEGEDSDEGDYDSFTESPFDDVVTTTIPHLWTDLPIAGPSSSSSTARVNEQASAATMSIPTLDDHDRQQESTAGISSQPPSVSTATAATDTTPSWSSAPPMVTSSSEIIGIAAGSTPLHTSNTDTNTGDTRCTSSCSYASSSWAPSILLDKDNRFSIVSSTGTSATSEEGGSHHHPSMISSSEIASKHNSLTAIMQATHQSASTFPSTNQAAEVTPVSTAMASSSSLPMKQSTTTTTTTSTCSAGPSSSSLTSTASNGVPAHKRSFLSSVLSRSTSLSGQSRTETLPRSRTISSSQGSSNSSSGVYAAASPGLASSNNSNVHARHASSTNSNVHARHASNPHVAISSSSSSINGAIPSPPRRDRRAVNPIEGRPSTSSSAAAATPVVPPPVDSVFSTASKPYIHEDDTQTNGRASSPSSSSAYGTGTTPTSRAARYLSRHFTGPASSTSGRYESTSEEPMRRSPTPTRFSSTAGASGSNTSGTRSTSMPMLSSTSNNSSSSLLAIAPQDNSSTSKCTPKAKDKGKQRPAPASAGPAVVPLSTFNLALNPLTPQLSLSRSGQPLCGAVLDEKYLLIGTTLGLDFIPLHREGNRSLRGGIFGNVSSSLSERFGVNTSSSSTYIESINPSSQHNGTPIGNGITDENLDKKVRKPIPLVKKTRFKQLVILSERSNVLLAIAGRNDHVRVYSLDTLRKLIEKKMKDIVDSNGTSTASKHDARNNMNKGLGLTMPKKVNTPISSDYKGKGRALPPVASSAQGQNTNADLYASSRQYSPPPAYEHTPASLASPYTASGDGRQDVPASSLRKPAHTSAEQETPSSATSTSFQSFSSSSQRGSHSPREHTATSPRALRRGKARGITSRRASNASNSNPADISGSSSRSGSRRGSSATVMPDTIAGMSTASMYTPGSSAGRRRSSVATIVPTSPNLTYSSGIHSTITRRGSTAQLADMGQVTSEQHIPRTSLLDGEHTEDGSESYEWVDAPEDDSDSNEWAASGPSGYSFPPHPAAPRRDSIPAVPPLPEQYATFASVSTSSVAHARARSASGISSSTTHRLRMTPRSARTRVETYSEEEDEEAETDQVDNASVYATPSIGHSEILNEEQEGQSQSPRASTSSSVPLLLRPPTSSVEDERKRKAAQAKKNRRLSLADILNESRADPFQIEDAPPVPTSSRNAFTDPLPSTSRFSDSLTRTSAPTTSSAGAFRQPVIPRKFEARSATAKSTHGGLSDLADFLNEGPSETVDTAASRGSTSASASTSTSPFSLSRPSGFLRRTLTTTSIPEMRQRNRTESPVTTPLLNSRSPSLSSFTTSTSARTPSFAPRDAQILKMDTEELAGRDSLLDLLREGPSQEKPIDRDTRPLTTPRRASHSRKLLKGQHQSSASLQSNKSSTSNPATPSLTAQRSASVPQSQMQVGTPTVSTHVGGIAPRHRTRSDGATMHRNGNYILPADEIIPVPVTVTTPAPTDPFAAKTRKRRSLQPRSPTFRQFIAEFDPQPPTIDPVTGQAQQMARGLSLQEMLACAGSDDTASPVLGSEDDSSTPFARAGNVAGHATGNAGAAEGQAQMRNRRNRWSLLNGLRSSPSADDAPGIASVGRQSESNADEPVEPRHGTSAESRNVGLSASTAMSSNANSTTLSGLPPILKPVRPDLLMDDESPPFGNLTPDMQQQLAEGASDPDGTTIMFTQQTTRASGEVISTSSALNGSSAIATSAQSRLSSKVNSAGTQKDPVSGNLEYVKLARTKGSRFIRASETGKRTYLAVLCGDAGERIELFTGAKNVSLSLNRTFVLPETPRTIEFQLQGEDLLDLYLIYDSAIFALEPSTVRVREVGIQRNERRQARRERDRVLRQNEILEGVGTSMPPPSPGSPPSRVARARDATEASETDEAEARPAEGLIGSQAIDAIQTEASSSANSRAPSMEEEAGPTDTATQSEAPIASNENESASTTTISSVVATNATNPETTTPADNTPASPTSGAPTTPYTTFQQLEFLPQIPPSALASSYIIPPTYETVLSASPNPERSSGMFINSQLSFGAPSVYGSSTSSNNVRTPYLSSPEFSRSATPTGGCSQIDLPPGALLTPNWKSPTSIQQQQYPDGQTPPLLSPVSLLANPSAKNIGPPGLFFVSKGRTSTGIVDGDGRSVIRKPISWLTASEEASELPEQYEGLNHFSRLEIVLSSTDKTGVCIAAFGPTCVRTIELGHPTQLHSIEVIPYEAFKRQSKSNALVKTLKNQGKEIPDEMVFVRDVTYLAKAGQCTFFAERIGSNVGIYSLGAAGYAFY